MAIAFVKMFPPEWSNLQFAEASSFDFCGNGGTLKDCHVFHTTSKSGAPQ
jgi:hypothetical protein